MKRRWIVMLGGCICLALMVGVLPFDLGHSPKAAFSAEPIKIGALLDFTGIVAVDGRRFERGIKLRLEEAGYKVAGRTIKLVIEDGQSDVTASLDKTKKLVESHKVNVIIGPLMGGVQIALGPYLRNNRIFSLPLINLEPELVENGNWIAYPSTSDKAYKALGWYAYDVLGYRKIATIGADYAAGYSYLGGVEAGFKEKGGVVIQKLWNPVGTIDYGPYISGFKDDAEMIASFVLPTTPLVTQYHEFGVKTPIAYVSISTFSQKDMQELDEQLIGSVGIGNYAWTIDTPTNKKFVDAFQKKYGSKPDEHEANAYVVTSIILAGLEATKGDDSFDKLRPAVLGLNLDTPQGPLSFSPSGVGIMNRYLMKAQRVGGECAWVVTHTYR